MLKTIAFRDNNSIGTFSWEMTKDVAECLQDAQVNLRKSAERMGLPKEDWDKPFEQLVRAIEENIRGSLLLISASIARGPSVVDYLERMEGMIRALGLEMISERLGGEP